MAGGERRYLKEALRATKHPSVRRVCKDLRQQASPLLGAGRKAWAPKLKELGKALYAATVKERAALRVKREAAADREIEKQRQEAARWAEVEAWLPHGRRIVQAELRKRGFARQHTSGFGSNYYKHPDGRTVRIADHHVPQTEARMYYQALHHGCSKYTADFVFDRIETDEELRADVAELLDEEDS